MAGHVFLASGKVSRLACDAYVLPCDATFSIPAEALPPGFQGDPPEPRRSHLAQRVARIPNWPAGLPEPWPVEFRAPREDREWILEGVRQFLGGATDALAGHSRFKRVKPLLALDPAEILGLGGTIPEDRLRELLDHAGRATRELDIDLALVTTHVPTFLRLQALRSELFPELFDDLDPDWRGRAETLAAQASHEQLVLCIGPKAAVGMGFPLPGEFYAELGERLGMSPEEQARLARVNLQEQASMLEARCREAGLDLRQEAARRFASSSHSLTHCLLASLPVDFVLTTSFDTFYEQACEAQGTSLSVVPYEHPRARERQLLKLHGCVTHPEDIVLTRADFRRENRGRALLEGMAQALLLTRKVLLVGYSLRDDSFFRNDFFRLVDTLGRSMGPRSPEKRLATSLHLFGDSVLETLWSGRLDPLVFRRVPGQEADPEEWRVAKAEASRAQKIFLDYLLSRVDLRSRHLMDPDFEEGLSGAERSLRDHLRRLLVEAPEEAREAPGWWRLELLHQRFGGPEPGE